MCIFVKVIVKKISGTFLCGQGVYCSHFPQTVHGPSRLQRAHVPTRGVLTKRDKIRLITCAKQTAVMSVIDATGATVPFC